jgi:hypothetical protein
MKLCLALLLGCSLVGCTLKSPYVIEPRVLRWTIAVTDRYDFAALSDFVNKTIQAPYDWQGLDVSKRYAQQWGFRPGECMLVGDNWIFGSPDPKDNSFVLITSFPQRNSKSKDVTLHCWRRARDSFEVVHIEIVERELDIGLLKRPNKAPEPTPASVTPRATS